MKPCLQFAGVQGVQQVSGSRHRCPFGRDPVRLILRAVYPWGPSVPRGATASADSPIPLLPQQRLCHADILISRGTASSGSVFSCTVVRIETTRWYSLMRSDHRPQDDQSNAAEAVDPAQWTCSSVPVFSPPSCSSFTELRKLMQQQ